MSLTDDQAEAVSRAIMVVDGVLREIDPDLPERKLSISDALILSAPPSDALIEAKVWLLRSFGRETLERAEQIKGNRKKRRKPKPKAKRRKR